MWVGNAEGFSMIRSTKLKNLTLLWYRDMSAGNTGTTDRLFSTNQTGFLALGTDAYEWWYDPAAIKNEYQAITKAGGFEVTVDDLDAYCEDNVGWVMGRAVFQLPNEVKISIRQSYILHQEGGEWNVVHVHGFVGVPNADIGSTLG